MEKVHKVYLVGAGPGDPGLITVRGAELLGLADAVVYDFLANAWFLGLMKQGGEAVYVGKKAGSHSRSQDEINRLLVDLWKEGKTVVRLKGGDPFVFARGGEEALVLAEEGIPFEVVPGVTSGLAGLAYAGIPPTHRGLAVSAVLATGHEDPLKGTPSLDLKAIAACGGTIIIYMGVGNLSHITKGLIEGGLSPATPAALVHRATLPEQKTLTATLEDIGDRAKAAGMKPPAILAVGDVVRLRKDLAWAEKRPLFGKRIVITRPREQSSKQRKALEDLGACVVEHPAITIAAVEDTGELDQAIRNLSGYRFVIFTSVNGVRHFFDRLHALGHDARKLAGCRLCVIGPGTGEALEAQGLRPDLIPPKYTSASLVPAMKKAWNDLKGAPALLPRADIAPDAILDDLEKAGIEPEAVTAYRTLPAEGEVEKLKKAMEAGEVDAVTFASSSAARNFVNILGEDFLAGNKANMRFVSIGPVTTETLKSLGFPPDAEAVEHTIPGLTQALVELLFR
jgi:uroporphyrinogen III methyltransferase/synthase